MVFFWLVAAWVKSRAERPSVSGVNRQLHVQIGCKFSVAILAQAAVSVQNPPSGSQTCFPGGWVR